MIDPEEAPPEAQAPNVATIAFLGLVAGLVLWLGGACLVMGSGDGGVPSGVPQQQKSNVSTPRAASPTSTALSDRTDCAAIRGTDYRSAAERQWFLANCQ